MRGETTCPECSGPVDDHGYTTADPARLARLEELLREINLFFKNSGGWAEVHSHIYESWQDRIAALLGGTDGTE